MRNGGSALVPDRGPSPAPWSPEDPAESRRESRSSRSPVVGLLRRRKWTILGTAIVVMAAAVVLTLLWPETYQSTATILIQSPAAEDQAEIPGLPILERVQRTSTLETEAELIQSRRVVSGVVDSLDLHVGVETGEESRPAIEALDGFEATPDARPGVYLASFRDGSWTVTRDEEAVARAEPGEAVSLDGLAFRLPEPSAEPIRIRVTAFSRAVSGVRQRIAVSPAAQESDLLEVTCESSRAAGAERLCSATARGYVALRSELQRTSAAGTAEFLRDQVQEYEDRLAAAEDTLQTFATANRGVALGEQASEEVRTFAGLRAQRDQLEAERRALSRMLDRARRSGGGSRAYRDLASFPSLLRNEGVSQMLGHLAELENRRSELAQRRTELNPELSALDRRIETLDRQLGEMARSYERSLAEQIASLEQAIGSSSGRLSDFPERQVEMARLERRVQQLSGMYETLNSRLREAEVAEAIQEPRVRIVDSASRPVEPASPRPLMNLALAMMLGLAFGVAVAMVRDHGDTRIHHREELERRTDLPVLALLPHVDDGAAVLPVTASNGDAHEGEVRDAEGRQLVPAERRERSLRRLARHGGNAVALETFRSLGADLHFVSRGLVEGDLRSLAITSAGRGDGKTYVSCNLALTRAAFGVHTLLVDADMRAGGVARFFDLEPTPGLSELLDGTTAAREARRMVKAGEGGRLSVMPSGTTTGDAAALLETSYFEAMLAGAEAVYDLVVIDTPPLNVLPDTAAVVANADAVLVVVREDVTDMQALEFTLERLRRVDCPVIGVVYNDVALPKQYGATTYAMAGEGGSS